MSMPPRASVSGPRVTVLAALLLAALLPAAIADTGDSAPAGTCLVEADLTAEQREAISVEWTKNGLAEHASVASFSRFSLQLMAASAPSSLLEGAHLAAIDEIDHAKLCFGLASSFGGRAISPGAFPVTQITINANLSFIIAAVISEGCVQETLSAVRAATQVEQVEHPGVRKALTKIANDEAKHAALAWKTARWLLHVGGDALYPVATAAFAKSLAHRAEDEVAREEEDRSLEGFGVLDHGTKLRWDGANKAQLLERFADGLLSGEEVELEEALLEEEYSAPLVQSVIAHLRQAIRPPQR